MNTQHTFAPQARAALHCDALLAHRLTDRDRLSGLARFAANWSGMAAQRLAAFAGQPPAIAFEEPVLATPASFSAQVDLPGAAHRLLALSPAEAALHVSIAPDGVDGAVAKIFGGVPAPAPTPATARKKPRTSTTIIQQRIISAFEAVLRELVEPAGLAVQPLERSGKPGKLPGGRDGIAVLAGSIEGLGPDPLRVIIGLRLAALATIGTVLRASEVRRTTPQAPTALRFGDVPLSLRAVLADAPFPLRQIAALQVGQTLSLPLNRRVPLICGDNVIAWGTVGEIDDRAALRVSELPSTGAKR